MKKILSFFRGDHPRQNESVSRMLQEIDRLGGLHFAVTSSKDEWVAECENAPGIITGGPRGQSFKEIDANIKDAIFTAFRIPAAFCDERLLWGPFDVELETPIEGLPSFTYTGQYHVQ